MLGQGDKFDLCADTVTLDYEELLKTAKIAVRFSRDDLHRRLATWNVIGKYPTPVDAQYMREAAEALATATTSLYVLQEGLDREVLRVAGRVMGDIPRQYNKITLIKLLREMLTSLGYHQDECPQYPVGLKDCKDIVESLMDSLKRI
jgi:hypothetical protein